jgi:anti-sigma regulatory factor (Ser/Thr protein kinase)
MTRDELLIRLWPTPQACTNARHAVREFCSSRGLDDLAYDAELLTSEVMSNAVRYSDGMLTVLLVHAHESLAVTVSDNNAHVPSMLSDLPDELAESGRGLAVLDSVAGDWGMAPGDAGKTVWFRLP